ncbi:MAG: hypothetical protein RR177_03730 [Oscillospiraceae bacterium]
MKNHYGDRKKKACFKKKSMVLSTVVASFFLLSLTVFAFFNIQSSFDNKLTVGKIASVISEEFSPPATWNGNQISKKVSFKNTGDVDLVLRFQYAESWISSTGVLMPNAVDNIDVCTKNWTNPDGTLANPNQLAGTDWYKGDDGWNYYKAVMPPAKVVAIMDSIKTSTKYTNDYHGAKYKLSFVYETVLMDTEIIKSSWKKTPTVSGGTITWK